MPQPTVAPSAARKSHTGFFVGIIVGIFIGVALCLAGGYLLLKSASGSSLLREYFVSAAISQVASGQVATLPTVSSVPVNVPVPKQFAGQDYYVALNATLNVFDTLASTTMALGDTLEQIQAQANTGNYNGLFNLVYQAKGLIATGQGLNTQFSASLQNLSAANATTTDSQTKAFTDKLLGSGETLHGSIATLYTLVDTTILSGVPPTSAQSQTVIAQAQTLETQSQTFATDVQAAVQYFANYH